MHSALTLPLPSEPAPSFLTLKQYRTPVQLVQPAFLEQLTASTRHLTPILVASANDSATASALQQLTRMLFPGNLGSFSTLTLALHPSQSIDPNSWQPSLQMLATIPVGYHFHSCLQAFEDASFQGSFISVPTTPVPPTWHLTPCPIWTSGQHYILKPSSMGEIALNWLEHQAASSPILVTIHPNINLAFFVTNGGQAFNDFCVGQKWRAHDLHSADVMQHNFTPYQFLLLMPGIESALIPAAGLSFAQAQCLLDNLQWLFSLAHTPNYATINWTDPIQDFNASSVLGMGLWALSDVILHPAVEHAWTWHPHQFSFALMHQLCQLLGLVTNWVDSNITSQNQDVLIHSHLAQWSGLLCDKFQCNLITDAELMPHYVPPALFFLVPTKPSATAYHPSEWPP